MEQRFQGSAAIPFLFEDNRLSFQTEMALKLNPKLLDQLQYCEKNQVELCVIVGSSEVKNGTVKIRDVKTREEVRSVRSLDH